MEWKKLLIDEGLSVKDTLKRMDVGGKKILFVIDKKNQFLGVVTDGDIRRHILRQGKLEASLQGIYNTDPVIVSEGYDRQALKKLVLKHRLEVVPVLNQHRHVVQAISWNELFDDQESAVAYRKIPTPVVVMAGGKGERLDLFTKILPKPLIPIGEKPIIELIIDKFISKGFTTFHLTLNYKGEMIKSYLDSVYKKCDINYLWEKKFLGTAGSLSLLPAHQLKQCIVSNCDVIVDVDYHDLLSFHESNKNLVTVVGSIQHHKLPYGVIQFKKSGQIQTIEEKPEYDMTINTGVYVISSQAFSYLPKNAYFHMTDLVDLLIKKEKKVGVYPVSQNSYIDVGQWDEYKSYIEKLSQKLTPEH